MKKKPTSTTTLPAKPKPGNVAIILKAFEKEAAPLVRKLGTLEIKTKEDYERAAVLMKELKSIGKKAKDRLNVDFVIPAKTISDNAKNLFQPFLALVVEWEVTVKEGMRKYLDKSKDVKAGLDARYESGSLGVEKYLDKVDAVEVDSNVRRIFRAVATDVDATPREYLVPDEPKIREALKNGKKVKGWVWEQQETIAI